MQTTINSVFVGSVQAMPGDGRPTGIFKQPRTDALVIERNGLVDDAQADLRVHGGPEKALHQLPIEHYDLFRARFPGNAAQFVAGSLGENFSTQGWREEDVCVGDVYALGTARVQLSQPRTPCWKIDARHGVDGLTLLIERLGVAGWYYRVLAPGLVQKGDTISLLERNSDPLSLRDYWQIHHQHRPERAALQRVIATPGLAPHLVARWQQRLAWISKQQN